MKIHGRDVDGIAHDAQRAVRGVERTPPTDAVAGDRTSGGAQDIVEISSEGRARAAGIGADPAALDAALSPKQRDAIRARVQSGAFDTAEMAERVARRLLEHGII
jgi:hypothetical protein